MEKYIGCMVSLDCGETLGVYQGQVESIDPVHGTITLIRSFRNGIPYKLPHVTLRSQDINHLEIIKSSEDAKQAVQNEQFFTMVSEVISNNNKVNTSTSAPQPKIAPVKQLVVLGQNRSEIGIPAFPEINQNSRLSYNGDTPNKTNRTIELKSKVSSITPPNNFGRSQQFDSDHFGNCRSNQEFQKCSDTFNENDSGRSITLYGSRDCSKKASSPMASSYKLQGNANCGNYWPGEMNALVFQNSNGFTKYKDNSRNPFVRTSNSFTDHSHYPIPYFHKGFENQFSPLHKPVRPVKRNNSECFDHCDGNFDVDFDFEKNLALFDKAAVAQEVMKESSNSLSGNGHNGRQYRNGYQLQQEKYKCDENILKGVEITKKQISVTESSESKISDKKDSVVLGEYSADSGLIVPGVTQFLRDKLFLLAEKMDFSHEKMVEAFGRSLSDATLQYLGGSTRFDTKNFHQRPNVVILCGSNQWQSAAAVGCGRFLANRSSLVTIYYSQTKSTLQDFKEDPTFALEMKLFRMTEGRVVTDCRDLPIIDSIDLILSTLDSQISNKHHGDVVKWAMSKKAPVFSIEPSFGGPPLFESKRSFVCGLPPWFENSAGQVCFCDVGFPEAIYKAAGINYKSPFFDKFFITLHKNP